MVLGQELKHVQDGDGHPADGTAPELWRQPRLLVGPGNLPAFVPGVVPQPGLGILGVLFHHLNLEYRDFQVFRLVEGCAVFRQQRSAHVKAVQPHLIRQVILVPETAAFALGVFVHGIYQGCQSLGIALVPCLLVQLEQQDARLNVIHLSGVKLMDGAVLPDNRIHPTLDVIKILFVFSQAVGILHSGQKNALMVVETPNRRELVRGKLPH